MRVVKLTLEQLDFLQALLGWDIPGRFCLHNYEVELIAEIYHALELHKPE